MPPTTPWPSADSTKGPLDTYLQENPHLKRIVLCLDADGPGREATEKFQAEYAEKGYTVSARAPAQGKDWNEYLLQRGRTRERGEIGLPRQPSEAGAVGKGGAAK